MTIKLKKLLFLLFFYIILITEYIFGETTLSVEVPPGKFQCFFQTIKDNTHYKHLEIDYQVTDGGDLDINFMVVFGAEVLAQEVGKKEGNHVVPLKQLGDYQFCFDNTFSYQSRKVVLFELYLLDENGQVSEENLVKHGIDDSNIQKSLDSYGYGMKIKEFRNSFEKLKQLLNKIEYHQALLRAYESRDRAIMGANLSRVNLWSIINTIVIILVGCLHVFMIRSLFNENSNIGRLLRKT
uniref:GOLD domain-containing protein n=1 Tax=Strongyloides papillosus TaxID=174720 RepID=A0A0N5BT29_STREA